ncbi:gliding motility-associated ABC transporter substrate-binding protein GldG [Fulvivirgaceae bacterium BMA10]|uniref:Gliding motility-associated ABC transporter substrate-binding protein GldG n=1 Tax=Splendidivirga corallicola TaxID=3051826 RepID=A0ABT8KTT0_9BACT|nr:gliding motility-associated ABC transporter substrate-binding protein GldG [Fulvivirgaceae bacterium BMA10]
MVNSGVKMWESVLKFCIGVVLIILANVLASKYIFRIDLTEEKRFSITEASKDLLRNLDDAVYIDIYLEGDLPAPLKKLKKAARERLDEFKIYASNNIQYNFIDPSKASSARAREEFYKSLEEKGLQRTRLFDNADGAKVEKIIFPGAIVSYGGREKPVALLRGQGGLSAINESIEGLEYEFVSTIRGLTNDDKKSIGLIKGHNEADSLELTGLTNTLLETYHVFNVNLPRKQALEGYDAVIIAKPKKAFSEQDKYKLDQYIMRGGKVLFFVDMLAVNIDSALNSSTYALPIDLNLDDQLFKYGIRINRDYVQDLTAGNVPVVVGMIGDQPQIQGFKWPFFPMINRYADHPIVKNIDATYAKFINSMDTVKAEGILKTPLMFSSQYSRKLGSPLRVSLSDLRGIKQEDFYNQNPIALAYLLEGSFTSLYKNRFLPKGVDKGSFREQGVPTKLLIVPDGDFVRNEFSLKNGQPLDLGIDELTRQKFANDDFIKNALQYMLDDDGIITAKSKEIKIRPLDKIKIQEERLFWQVTNLALPVVLVVLYGFLRFFLRKRRFTNFKS